MNIGYRFRPTTFNSGSSNDVFFVGREEPKP